MTLQDRLSRLKLLVVTGKGGVGKSVLTAALGRTAPTGGLPLDELLQGQAVGDEVVNRHGS